MRYLIGTKVGMTRIFDNQGTFIPVTVIKVNDCWVIGKKNIEKHGYKAIHLGYGLLSDKKATKPYKGFFSKTGLEKIYKITKEFRITEHNDLYETGKELKVDIFKEGDYIDISGISKGKGFAGAMKRHGFHGLPSSHGHGEYRRAPGSMSASSYPSRVFKGKKLPGHLGAKKTTIQKLEVLKVDPETNILVVKGAVPGIKGSCLSIKETVKSKKQKKLTEVLRKEETKLKKKR